MLNKSKLEPPTSGQLVRKTLLHFFSTSLPKAKLSSHHLFVIYSNAKESCRQRSEETNKHLEWAWVFQIDAGISHQRTGKRRGILTRRPFSVYEIYSNQSTAPLRFAKRCLQTV